MGGFLRALLLLALLCVPVLILMNLSRLVELVPVATPSDVSITSPAGRPAREPLVTRPAAAPVDKAPQEAPPTLVPAPTATPSRATPTPSGERMVIGNTGGIGAVLRAEPVVGQPVASLAEQTIVTVLERRSVNGADWARVRTPQGQEGWVIGLVVRPAPG